MRAVWMSKFGPPEVLQIGEAPDREPGEGEALIEVSVAGITFIETQIRAGMSPRPGGGPELPLIPGNGVGGVVKAVGPGADGSLVGQRVVTSTGGSDGYAERAVVDAGELMAVPTELDLAEAVALLADGRTAIGLTRMAEPQQGEWVLVEAAGGGVGSLLVQLAAAAGARVIAAASSHRKRDLAARLGAEDTVDYTLSDWPEQVRTVTGGAGLDVAFDSIGGPVGRAAFELMTTYGRFLVFGMASGSLTDTATAEGALSSVSVLGLPQLASIAGNTRDLTTAALTEAAAGRLRPTIGQTYPLERAHEAHAAIEARTILGKTLLSC